MNSIDNMQHIKSSQYQYFTYSSMIDWKTRLHHINAIS